MPIRPNWFNRHPPSCTCVRCVERRVTEAGVTSSYRSHRGVVRSSRGASDWSRPKGKGRSRFLPKLLFAVMSAALVFLVLSFFLKPLESWRETGANEVVALWDGISEEDSSNNSASTVTNQSDLGHRADQSGENSPNNSSPTVTPYGLEVRVHDLVNEERARYGLGTLMHVKGIADIARNHSQDMAINNYVSHVNPRGEDSTTRASRVGYSCRKEYESYYTDGLAENIYQTWLFSSTTTTTVFGAPVYTSKDWSSLEEIALSSMAGWIARGSRQASWRKIMIRQESGLP